MNYHRNNNIIKTLYYNILLILKPLFIATWFDKIIDWKVIIGHFTSPRTKYTTITESTKNTTNDPKPTKIEDSEKTHMDRFVGQMHPWLYQINITNQQNRQ